MTYMRQDSKGQIHVYVHMEDETQVVPDFNSYENRAGNVYQNILQFQEGQANSSSMIPSTVNMDFLSGSQTNVNEASHLRSMQSEQEASNFNSESAKEDALYFDNIISDNGGRMNDQLRGATKEALVNHTLMPLIKEELKWSIQSKRLQDGKGELKVEFTEPEPDILTEEEQEKVEKRRIQNKEAARRFRDRQKNKGSKLQQECHKLESINTQLRYEINKLKAERDTLRTAFDEHLKVCPQRVPTNFYSQAQTYQVDNT